MARQRASAGSTLGQQTASDQVAVDPVWSPCLQAYGGKARPTDASEQAGPEGIAAADSSAGHGEGDEQGGSWGEGMSSSLAGEEGSASDGSSSGGNSSSGARATTGSHGRDGKSGALVEEQQRQALHASKEEAWRREFVDPYQQIVSEVLDSMLLVSGACWESTAE